MGIRANGRVFTWNFVSVQRQGWKGHQRYYVLAADYRTAGVRARGLTSFEKISEHGDKVGSLEERSF